MADKHTFFTVKRISHKGYAIRYTPKLVNNESDKFAFGMAFDVLIAGESLADKEVSLQLIADVLNEATGAKQ